MTAPTPNAELAYRVLDHIDAHPEKWQQGVWVGEEDCGTVACFAGWTVLLSGGRFEPGERVCGLGELDGKYLWQAADALLGISFDSLREHNLPDPYDGLHTRDSLGQAVAELFGPRPEPVDEQAWRECAYRADYTTAAEHGRECEYHRGEVDEDGLPVDDVPPNAGSAS